MIIYIRLGGVRAVTVEYNKEFGGLPLYKRKSYHCETIVDMPYTQIIFTSGKWTPTRRAANDKQKTIKTAIDPARTDLD